MPLSELKTFAGPRGPLENMQVLKISRLSVTEVMPDEWSFIVKEIESKSGE